MQFSETEVQVFGRISAIEFVLEVMLANELASQDPADTEKFKADLVSKPGYLRRGPISASLVQALDREVKSSLENFVQKVSDREADIRERKAPGL